MRKDFEQFETLQNIRQESIVLGLDPDKYVEMFRDPEDDDEEKSDE